MEETNMKRQTIIAVFPSRGSLIDAVDRVKTLTYLKIKHSAVIVKADDGETVLLEDDISVSEGSIAGGTLGSLMGALGIAGLGAFLLPGVGPIIAIGAGALLGGLIGGATGGITASLIDLGIKDEQLEDLAAHLSAGRVAMVLDADAEEDALSRLRTDLQPYDAEISVPQA
jgi:uncharacterized membrane protein